MSAYEVPVSVKNTSGLAANNVEIDQNEAYIATHHPAHFQEHNSQAADRKTGTTCSTTEIRAVQNTSYEPTHSPTAEPGHVHRPSASDDDSVYTYIMSAVSRGAVL